MVQVKIPKWEAKVDEQTSKTLYRWKETGPEGVQENLQSMW